MDQQQQMMPDNQPIDPQHPAMTTTGYALGGVGEGLEEQGRDLNRSAETAATRSRSRSRDAEENKDAAAEAAPAEQHTQKRDGDWECPNCHKNVFAFKSTCFSCGTTKPGGVAGARPGDWECPSCFKNVFASRHACFNCGQPKPYMARSTYAPAENQYASGTPVCPEGGKPGDWLCPNASCAEHCFASRNSCRKCGAPKPGSQQPQQGGGGGGAWGGQGGGGGMPDNHKPGDWMCPNQQCGEHCFASRMQCRKCGAPKPGMQQQQQGGWGGNQGMWGGNQGYGGYQQQGYPPQQQQAYGYAQGYGGMPGGGMQGPAQLPPDAKLGDWMCPNPQCAEHCFASRQQCRKCGSAKPGGYGGGGGWGEGGGGGHNPMMDQRNKPGDWMCPNANCRDLCFASRNECRKCGTAKPEGGETTIQGDQGGYGGGGGGYGGGGYGGGNQAKPGDWVCPNPSCRDLVFASKSACRKCGTTKP